MATGGKMACKLLMGKKEQERFQAMEQVKRCFMETWPQIPIPLVALKTTTPP